MAVIVVTFEWINIDIVGPLTLSVSCHKYILVVVNYVARGHPYVEH